MVSLPADLAKAEALARFQAPPPEHINCGQAVLVYALLRLDEDPDAITEAKYFGGGIAGMGEICGVLNGLALALGVRDLALSDRGEQPPADTPDQIRGHLSRFRRHVRVPLLPGSHRFRPHHSRRHDGLQDERHQATLHRLRGLGHRPAGAAPRAGR